MQPRDLYTILKHLTIGSRCLKLTVKQLHVLSDAVFGPFDQRAREPVLEA